MGKVVHKVVIMARHQDGQEETRVVKRNDHPLTRTDVQSLRQSTADLIPKMDDFLYFTGRISANGVKDNFKVDATYADLCGMITDIERRIFGTALEDEYSDEHKACSL